MSLTEFSIHLGVYDTEFMRTPTYDALLTSKPVWEPLSNAWLWLSLSPTYDPCSTKATILNSPILRYIHFMVSHTLTGRGDNTSVVTL